MRFFIDTADIGEIRELVSTGLVDGVTTNPSLVAKSGRPFLDALAEICEVVPGPVSAEVAATQADDMLKEARRLGQVAKNVCIKLPLTWDGLKACKALSSDGVQTNVTLCFSAAQALLAAKVGATYVSPFIGRLDDIGQDGMGLIATVVEMFANYPETLGTQVLVASVRTPNHVIEAARLGAHVLTLPPAVLRSLVSHPLTDKGLAAFTKDWAATGQRIV